VLLITTLVVTMCTILAEMLKQVRIASFNVSDGSYRHARPLSNN